MSNITSLEQIKNDTLADVEPLNKNFEAIRVAINDNDSNISNLNTNKADNNTTVHTINDEIINGIKTFNSMAIFNGGIDFGSPIISKFNIDSTGFVIKFSNKFVIQVGKVSIYANNSENRVTLKEEMENTDYFCFGSSANASYSSSSDYGTVGVIANDTTSIYITVGRMKTTPSSFFWLVCGMAKE